MQEFWNILENWHRNENFLQAGRVRLTTYFMLVSHLAYSSTLKMEVTRSSEMLAGFQETTATYDSVLHADISVCVCVCVCVYT
jgi:hypothetical protein